MTPDAISILVASDDATLVTAITHSLDESGYRLHDGASLAPGDQPGLIVLDCNLTTATHVNLLRSLRSTSGRPAWPPIIALSSLDTVRQTATLDGVWVCLAKPVELDTLLGAIDRITLYTADQLAA